ncbi:MAG: methyltransferase [Treponema sp.]|nr:methyltransferase [Treponema sp.]
MEQTDTLLNGNKIIQDSSAFMFGIDAVLLAEFACSGVRSGDTVADLGTGNGILPLLMEKGCKAAHFTGLEIQKKSVELARRSVELNSLTDKIDIVAGDLKNVATLFPKHSFNVVVSNPPYALVSQGKQNLRDEKTIARHEVLCTIEDVVAAADFLLHTHGKFFMIHRPERLAQIFESLARHSLEPKQLQFIQPFEDEGANLVLIEARKNAQPGIKMLPTVNVRNSRTVS